MYMYGILNTYIYIHTYIYVCIYTYTYSFKLTNDIATLDGFTLFSSTIVRNLRVIFDQDLC